ncbi:MAG: hypothetical protein ACRENP_18690 [Longimicrobiales bacterium]
MRSQMEKLRDHREAALKQVATVLSAVQQAKLREVIRPMGRGRSGLRRGRA